MGDESNSSTPSLLPSIRISQSISGVHQETLSRLPSGLYGTSRKRQIQAETYEVTREFTDPDPGKSRLCYECNATMNNLHCHPWSDARRVQIPIGETGHYAPWFDHCYLYRSLRVVDKCALCSMILEIVTAKICHSLEDRSSISDWRYLLKPTHFGEVFDSDPRRSFGQEVSVRKTRHARWYLGIEINDLSGSKPLRLIPNAIQGAIRPLPKPFRGIYTRREQSILSNGGSQTEERETFIVISNCSRAGCACAIVITVSSAL